MQRRFHRITFSASGTLSHQGITYHIQTQNISLRGALISADDAIIVPVGESCTLSLDDGAGTAMVIDCRVVHSFYSMAGVEFLAFAKGAEDLLHAAMNRITGEPERLKIEWEEILGRIERPAA